MEKVWYPAAAACLAAAFVFFWFRNFDGVFVVAVIGCLTWLIGYRAQTRRRIEPNQPDNS